MLIGIRHGHGHMEQPRLQLTRMVSAADHELLHAGQQGHKLLLGHGVAEDAVESDVVPAVLVERRGGVVRRGFAEESLSFADSNAVALQDNVHIRGVTAG